MAGRANRRGQLSCIAEIGGVFFLVGGLGRDGGPPPAPRGVTKSRRRHWARRASQTNKGLLCIQAASQEWASQEGVRIVVPPQQTTRTPEMTSRGFDGGKSTIGSSARLREVRGQLDSSPAQDDALVQLHSTSDSGADGVIVFCTGYSHVKCEGDTDKRQVKRHSSFFSLSIFRFSAANLMPGPHIGLGAWKMFRPRPNSALWSVP